MPRHVFLVPGFFGFASPGDFTCWWHVNHKLSELLRSAGIPAEIHCAATAQADHLDIVGHFMDEEDPQHPYDWLTTRSNFRSPEFHAVRQQVMAFFPRRKRLRVDLCRFHAGGPAGVPLVD